MEVIQQSIDGISFELKEPFNFDFIGQYGKVFKVYDDQDSGNICFGTERDGKRFFVKFAGAPAKRYEGEISDAIVRLKASVPLYHDLKHKSLIELVDEGEIGGGFAMIFLWEDGDCMGRMYPQAHERFMKLPCRMRLEVFRDVLSFLEQRAMWQLIFMMEAFCMTSREKRPPSAILIFSADNPVSMIWGGCGEVLCFSRRRSMNLGQSSMK